MERIRIKRTNSLRRKQNESPSTLSYTPVVISDQVRRTDDVLDKIDLALTDSSPSDWLEVQKKETKSEGLEIQKYISHFDTNWRSEGLPQDWFNLRTIEQKHVGFVIKNQMDLLKNIHDKTSLADWAVKTERDLEGFKLEFLTDHNVYTRKYIINKQEGRIEDPFYGVAKEGKGFTDIVETISEEERNGSVKESLGRIRDFLLDAPDGSIGFMNSPLGKTGFKTPDGRGIDYIESYVFLLQKQGDTVMNYTIKTDFKLPQCRAAIEQLTGKKLPEDAPLEDYVRSIALIPGEKGINNLFEVIRVLETVQPTHAFKDKETEQHRSWSNVYEDILQGESLYNFDVQTKAVISEFGEYAKAGGHTKEELQKAIAVTVLRMSELFFQAKNEKRSGDLEPNVWFDPLPTRMSFGEILKKTAAQRGCSGGGDVKVFINGLGVRLGVVGGGKDAGDGKGPLEFECPAGHPNKRKLGQELEKTCTTCGARVDGCEPDEMKDQKQSGEKEPAKKETPAPKAEAKNKKEKVKD